VDIAEAMRWYTKAAKQGDPDAQNALGYIYAKGQGTALDYVKAYIWWTLSEAQGNQQAARGIDTISQEMSEQQIKEAQRLTVKCFNSEQRDCY
jgi:TPR repeat protein